MGFRLIDYLIYELWPRAAAASSAVVDGVVVVVDAILHKIQPPSETRAIHPCR